MSNETAMSEDDITIHEFQKNALERVRVSLRTYKGHRLIDIRVLYQSGEGYRPSPKGACFSVALLPELEAAIERLRQAAGDVEAEREVT